MVESGHRAAPRLGRGHLPAGLERVESGARFGPRRFAAQARRCRGGAGAERVEPERSGAEGDPLVGLHRARPQPLGGRSVPARRGAVARPRQTARCGARPDRPRMGLPAGGPQPVDHADGAEHLAAQSAAAAHLRPPPGLGQRPRTHVRVRGPLPAIGNRSLFDRPRRGRRSGRAAPSPRQGERVPARPVLGLGRPRRQRHLAVRSVEGASPAREERPARDPRRCACQPARDGRLARQPAFRLAGHGRRPQDRRNLPDRFALVGRPAQQDAGGKAGRGHRREALRQLGRDEEDGRDRGEGRARAVLQPRQRTVRPHAGAG